MTIVEVHRGHVWGEVVAADGQTLRVAGTPRNPGTAARRIREFVRKNGE